VALLPRRGLSPYTRISYNGTYFTKYMETLVMKLAWIIYRDEDDWDEKMPDMVFTEPERYSWYYKVIPIVYAELVDE
jgi:hypothetical protein